MKELSPLLLMDRTNNGGTVSFIIAGSDKQWRKCVLYYWWTGQTIPESSALMGRTNNEGIVLGARGGVMDKALHYKPAGRGFNSRWWHWNFSAT
jgi:hypothetical protein